MSRIDNLNYAIETLENLCKEKLQFQATVSPDVIYDSNCERIIGFMVENATNSMASAVEKRLGERWELLSELDRAKVHIYEMEDLLHKNNISFMPYAVLEHK